MHVLLLAPAIEDYCLEYANALAGSARVTLLAPARVFSKHAGFLDPSVDVRLLDWPRHSSLKNIVFVYRLIRLIGSLRPDVVHFLSEGVTWLNLIIPSLRGRGIVTTMHDVAYHPGDRASRRVPRWSVDWLIGRSDRVIVHGARLRADAERRYPKLRGRIDVLPHVQLRRYLTIATKQGMRRDGGAAVTILFFGRIYAYKGLDVLIRSIAIVTERFTGIRVIVAGTGDDIDGYKAMVADPRYFEFRTRYIPDEETAQLFTDADIVVLPYVEASQSGVLAIANAFGKPVVVTDVGELAESVENGVSGLVVPARDVAALAEAILRLVLDRALRDALGQAGRSAADATTSPEVIAAGALETYGRVLAGKGARDVVVPATGGRT